MEGCVDISVLVATYNRSEDLRLTLNCLVNQVLSAEINYEVLVIDNNSTDNTRAVTESYAESFKGRLRCLFEPTQGQSNAHNNGIREAKGDIIVLTDDDCTFGADYLQKIYAAFQAYGRGIGFIGGRCSPRWVNCRRPEWFVDLAPGWWSGVFFSGPLAILDYGQSPFVLDADRITAGDKRLLYGANMAVRKSLFEKHGSFNVHKPVTQDTELQMRFLRNGERGLYAPEIEVHHKISPERLTPQHYYRWYYSRGTLLDIEEQYHATWYYPFGIAWSLIFKTIRLLVGSLIADSTTKRIYRRCHALFYLGQMNQLAKRRLSGYSERME